MWSMNEQNRMRLRLSPLAMAVYEEEEIALQIKSPSDWACTIFENYYDHSPASIGRTLANRTQILKEILGDASLVRKLIESEKQQLLDQCQWEKGDTLLPVRIQNNALETLMSCEKAEEKYYKKCGNYFCAVIESYCRLDWATRQRVFFSPLFEQVTAAIQQKKLIRVTIESRRNQEGNKQRTYLMRPCILQTDKLASNWYVAGFSCQDEDEQRNMKPASFRMASILDLKMLNKSTFVSSDQHRDLETQITQKGIQFLVGEQIRIRVKMTESGEKQYYRIATLRPKGQRISGTKDEWEFHCTPLQAERYFLRLGQECQILEPLSLRKKMAEIFSAAAEKYSEKEETVI